jgi:hypothetical protein
MKMAAWISLVLAVACSISGAILDPDLWWHITVGRWILAHQQFPVTDHWNLFGIGTEWRAYSWLFDVAVAAIDRHLGDHGLLLAQLLLLALICGALCGAYRAISGSWFAGSYLGVIVTFAMTDHYTLRPQSIIWILEAVVIALAFAIVDGGASRRRLLALVAIMCVWANLHITTVLGLGIAGSILLGAVPLPVACRVLAVGFLATLLTPYLGREWLIFLSMSSHPLDYRGIAELQPATIMQLPTLFVLLMAALAGVAGSRHLRSWPPLLTVGAGVMVFGGLVAMRFLPMAIVLLAAIVARSLRLSAQSAHGADGAWERFIDVLRYLESLWNRLPHAALAPALLFVAALFFAPHWREPIVRTLVPVALADFIINEPLPQPVLNDFGRGGYFMYRYADADGEPGQLVPIDGRTNAMPAERMNQYMDMAAGAENWRDFFDAVDPRTVIFQTDSPLVAILQATGNWCVIGRIAGSQVGTALLLRRDELERRRQLGRATTAENCP